MSTQSSGCLSFLAALGMILVGAVVGCVFGIPAGSLGVAGGAFILPWALVMGTIGWGIVSLPYLVVRWLVPTLPEASTPRAVVGFLLLTPPSAAWAGWYLASTADLPPLWLVLEPIGFGLVAVPIAIATAVFGRYGMLLFLVVAGEAAGS